MFANHWIVADMDGTLTPTPSRAHGKYLSLSHCMSTGLGYGARYRSCLPWLRLFIEGGGSLCVVSTAGKRMWMQLYEDLAPSVFGLTAAADTGDAHLLSTNTKTATSTSGVGSAARCERLKKAGTPGTLYMCGFTGAALFRTRPCPAVWADMDRLHPGWRRHAALDKNHNHHSSSNVNKDDDHSGTRVPTDVVVPPPSVGIEEWAAYRQQAVECAACTQGSAAPAPVHGADLSFSSSTTLDAATYTLAVEEGRRAIIRFFEHASYVSGHDANAAAAFFAACLSTKYHAVYTEILRQLLAEARPALRTAATTQEAARSTDTDTTVTTTVPHLCFANSKVLSPEALATYGLFLRETNDALVDAQQVPSADGTTAAGAPVAQVTVMGIPMRYFDAIFPSPPPSATSTSTRDGRGASAATSTSGLSVKWQCCAACAAAGAGAKARMEAAGIEVKPQPNSVCLHRRGVDKGMCVRWLMTQGAEAEGSAAQNSNNSDSNGCGDDRSKAAISFDLTRALAFGDVPESVDRPLTAYPPMQFISLSPKDGAAEKLAAMHAGADRAQAASYMYHVGGEEEGTALFLQELLTSCLTDGAEQHVESSTAGVQTLFTPERVAACAERAHAAVKALQEERLSAEAKTEPSRSTL